MSKDVAIKNLLDDDINLITSSELHKFTKNHDRKSRVTKKSYKRTVLPATEMKNGITRIINR
jgi:hypothetical protein